MKAAILSGTDFSESESTAKHKAWFENFKNNYTFTEENATEILRAEIGKTFVRVLCDAGVFKDNDEGREAFRRFIKVIE